MELVIAKIALAATIAVAGAEAAQAACQRAGHRFGPGIERAQSRWVV